MAKPNQPPLPSILIANDLLDGEVLFRTVSGWSPAVADALVAEDLATARQLEAEAAAATRRQEVVDAYLVEIARDAAGRPVPTHYRERIKTLGPSHRPDLGKQAAEAPAAGR
ncbi:Protein of unknown function [Tistlia consotensis]|uniref:DUF2849 domain-containing protein n=1 Tax=Tistlia consotensis USBA 355 TaxID=560819 RepID=A0A1Y6CJU1_9PROT|nr:DUF2849 domain-containing protein [Tistlia consotensis]SMF67140.1 Protein of unknown function [Tistlia consotensis USBA 355]SNS00410.1 Protein of unknown function [Tistlia consotensis]